MTLEETDAVLRRLFDDANKGAYSYLLRSSRQHVTEAFLALGDPVVSEIARLSHPSKDDLFKSVIAEMTVVFINSIVDGNPSSRHDRDKIVLSAEICVAEHFYEVSQSLHESFTPGDLWIALIHFESDEHVEPFTTDYLTADTDLKNRFIAHSCLDVCLPGSKVPDSTLRYASQHLSMLTEICIVARERRTLNVEQIIEAMKSHPKSISSGVL
jgi:hypothetical protein